MDVIQDDGQEEKKIYPNNYQKSLYDLQIDETEKLIERISARNEQLIEISAETKRHLALIDDETTNKIAELNHQLSTTVARIDNLKNSIEAEDRKRFDTKEKHIRATITWQDKYENTRKKLLSMIKKQTAKIHVLENYKNSRLALLEKLDDNDKLMIQRTKKLENQLRQIDHKIKTDQKKLYQDLQKNIYDKFQLVEAEETEKELLIDKRLFRENINILHELEQISIDFSQKKQKNIESEKTNDSNRVLSQSSQMKVVQALTTIRIQRPVMQRIKFTRQKCDLSVRNYYQLSDEVQRKYEAIFDKINSETLDSNEKLSKQLVSLHKKTVEFKSAEYKSNKLKEKIRNVTEILYDVKYAISCVLELNESKNDFASMDKSDLSDYLKDVVTR